MKKNKHRPPICYWCQTTLTLDHGTYLDPHGKKHNCRAYTDGKLSFDRETPQDRSGSTNDG